MGSQRSLARRIDHIVIEADDEERLFGFFTDVLGLPVAWPVAQWGAIHEGGASAGNCNLGCNHPLDARGPTSPTVRALALEPQCELDMLVDLLGDEGLGPTEPLLSGLIALPPSEPYLPWQQGWTTVMVSGAPFDPLPFFCAYNHDVADRRRREQAALAAAKGGSLGITGVQAVILHSRDVDRADALWTSLLGSGSRRAPGVFTLSAGPEVHIRHGAASPAIIFSVASLEAAVSGAHRLGLDTEGDGEVRLDPAGTMGLDIRLV